MVHSSQDKIIFFVKYYSPWCKTCLLFNQFLVHICYSDYLKENVGLFYGYQIKYQKNIQVSLIFMHQNLFCSASKSLLENIQSLILDIRLGKSARVYYWGGSRAKMTLLSRRQSPFLNNGKAICSWHFLSTKTVIEALEEHIFLCSR